MPEYLDESGVYLEEGSFGARVIEGVPTSTAIFMDVFNKGPVGKATPIDSLQAFEDVFGGIYRPSEASYGIYQFFLNGGKRAKLIRVPGRGRPGKRALITGLRSLPGDDLGAVDILCLPATANLNGRDSRAVYRAAIDYCTANRAFLIIDLPERAAEPAEAIEWAVENSELHSINTAAYYPWLEISHPEAPRQTRKVSPSGTIAGLYARTDSERGVWKAPAGITSHLHGVSALCYALSEQESLDLNSEGINPLRNFPEEGILCWGARTFDSFRQVDPKWRYVPVRRFALFIESSVYRDTQWAVFEPNGERLWANLRQTVDNFLFQLWRQGALMGETTGKAYFVRCDRTTMTQERIDEGIVNIQVGAAILKPAEFYIFNCKGILTGSRIEGRR